MLVVLHRYMYTVTYALVCKKECVRTNVVHVNEYIHAHAQSVATTHDKHSHSHHTHTHTHTHTCTALPRASSQYSSLSHGTVIEPHKNLDHEDIESVATRTCSFVKHVQHRRKRNILHIVEDFFFSKKMKDLLTAKYCSVIHRRNKYASYFAQK